MFAFARLLTAIPLTPGGVGVVELALITGLTSAGGDDAPVVAAVLLFRRLTYVLPILLGAFTYVFWRRNRSWCDSAPPLPTRVRTSSVGGLTGSVASASPPFVDPVDHGGHGDGDRRPHHRTGEGVGHPVRPQVDPARSPWR